MTRSFRLPVCYFSAKLFLLLCNVAVVALVSVFSAVSSSKDFTLSSLFYMSKFAIRASSRRFSDRSVKRVYEVAGGGVFLFTLSLTSVAESFLYP
jgi:hypothetical protein